VFSFLKKNEQPAQLLTTDIHSHFLASIDDGAKNWDETLEMLRLIQSLGYQKFITTPHIMSDVYRNEPIGIFKRLDELKKIIQEKSIDIKIEAAAEYYLDEELMKRLTNKEKLMTFGKNYLLFETNFLSEPLQTKEFIFQATSQGYQLILAHPERYEYMTLEKAEDLRNRGVLFQLNTLSVLGFYSRPVQRMAYKMIDRGWVEFLGTDCHSPLQARYIVNGIKNKYYQKALRLPLLNNSITL
jgi:protein-tyrosine phosphatase